MKANSFFKLFGKIIQDVKNLDGRINNGYAIWVDQYNSYSQPYFLQLDSPQDEMDLLSQDYKDGIYRF